MGGLAHAASSATPSVGGGAGMFNFAGAVPQMQMQVMPNHDQSLLT